MGPKFLGVSDPRFGPPPGDPPRGPPPGGSPAGGPPRGGTPGGAKSGQKWGPKTQKKMLFWPEIGFLRIFRGTPQNRGFGALSGPPGARKNPKKFRSQRRTPPVRGGPPFWDFRPAPQVGRPGIADLARSAQPGWDRDLKCRSGWKRLRLTLSGVALRGDIRHSHFVAGAALGRGREL